MKNTPYLIVIAIGLLLALIGYISTLVKPDYTDAVDWMYIGLAISQFTGLLMLFTNGTFRNSKYFKIVIGFFVIVIIGSLFKVLHYAGSVPLFSIGILGMVVVYILSFLKKPIKKRLDYLKVVFVTLSLVGGLLLILNVIQDDYKVVSIIVFWLAIIEYLRVEYKEDRLSIK